MIRCIRESKEISLLNIDPNSIADFSEPLHKLGSTFNGINYVVWLIGRGFSFTIPDDDNSIDFSLDNLRSVFCDEVNANCDHPCVDDYKKNRYEISGIINPISELQANNYINYVLGCDEYLYGLPINHMGLANVKRGVWENRRRTYWGIVKEHFPFHATHTFSHIGGKDSYFDAWIFWHFCYIYLNKHQQRGMVLAGGGLD